MQLFTMSFSAHARCIRTRNFLLRKSYEGVGDEIMKKLIQFYTFHYQYFSVQDKRQSN